MIKIKRNPAPDPDFARDMQFLTNPANPPPRAEALSIFDKYKTGKILHFAPNFSDSDAGEAIAAVINHQRGVIPEVVPDDVKHIVFAHGTQHRGVWTTLVNMRDDAGNPKQAMDYINETVPTGERAHCVICCEGYTKSLPYLEGRPMVSGSMFLKDTPPTRPLRIKVLKDNGGELSQAERLVPEVTKMSAGKKWAIAGAVVGATGLVGSWVLRNEKREREAQKEDLQPER